MDNVFLKIECVMDPRIVMMAVMNGDATQLVMYITFNVSMADNLILDFYLRNRKGSMFFLIIVFIYRQIKSLRQAFRLGIY